MLGKYYDKILFVLSLLVLVGFSVVFFQRGEQIAGEFDSELPPVRNINEYEMTKREVIEIDVPNWRAPQPQSSGVDWVYEIFTPPKIFYHAEEDRFVVNPPGPSDEGEVELQVEFLGFEEEPYRIQLTGFAGRDEDPLITFLNRETGEVIITRKNREVAEADFEVRSFAVHRVEEDGVVARIPEAVIYDRRSGEEIVLEEEETRYLDEPAIVVKTTENPPRTINARPGEVFGVGEYSYRVEEYTVVPPEIVLEKTGPDQEELRRETLVPGERF